MSDNSISVVVAAMIISFLPLIILLSSHLRRLWESVDFCSRSRRESETQMILKLVIDKNKEQVVFVECDNEFVDVLLSFLTLPMGTIIRVADDKRSGIGSMDELYKSVEAMNEGCFGTKACKNMLLEPRNANGLKLKNLAVKIDGIDYTKLYTCSKTPCSNYQSFGFISFFKNSICSCGRTMDKQLPIKYADGDVFGSFMSGTKRFIISDDLHVLPASISNARSLLLRQELPNNTSVYELDIHVGLQEVLRLLHYSLLSKTPLTDAFLPKAARNMNRIFPPDPSHRKPGPYQQSPMTNRSQQELKVKLWFSKSTKRVICIEAKEDFVDFLFSFLTIPLGSAIKLLKGNSLLGNIDNLYRNVRECSTISTRCKEMLLSPMVEHMFGCENQLLDVNEEVAPTEFAYTKSYVCSLQNNTTCCVIQYQRLKLMNPKCSGMMMTNTGRGFVRAAQGCFLVTDSLEVELFSPASGMSRLHQIPFSDLEELPISIGTKEALDIFKAAMTTRSVLTQAFGSRVNNLNNRYSNKYSRK